MRPWNDFYQRLAREALARAAKASDPSVKAEFEEVAKEWSGLARWVEQLQKKAAA